MEPQESRNYWKEIVGTGIWIALIAFLLWTDRIPGCSPGNETVDPRIEETPDLREER